MVPAAGDVRPAVVGTAGHIDHGKSSLVRALTGTDPDRLKEERERGLTIDLGYAEYRASDGSDVGLIDVPGHQRFVRNMVAGATGVDVVMLVVAADDGVMPQTREHLEILGLLGIGRGFVVMTKIDIADAEAREDAHAGIRDLVAGTFLDGAPVIPCSHATGEGLDAVRAEIERQVAAVPRRGADAPFRMPIQRAFTLAGHGTVVTGVPLSGCVRAGDSLEILPRGLACRVRGIHVHHRPADEGAQGHRVAVNLADAPWKEIARGDVLAAPGLFEASRRVEARLTLLASAVSPLRSHAPARFHAGCAEAGARVVLIDRDVLEPGNSALAQIRLDERVVVAAGDRFLIRSPAGDGTLGGGVVIGVSRFREKPGRAWVAETLARKEEAVADPAAALAAVVRGEGMRGVALADLPRLVHAGSARVAELVRGLLARGELVAIDGGRGVIHVDMRVRGAAEAVRVLLELHEKDHYAFGFTAAEVAALLRNEKAVVDAFLAHACATGSVARQEGRYRATSFLGALSQEDRRLIDAVEHRLRDGGMAAPSPAEIAAALGRPEARVRNLITLLQSQGRVRLIADNVALHMSVIRDARDKVVAHCTTAGELTSNHAKEVLGASRKYVIPLLEYFDAVGLTVRAGSSRRLKPGWARSDTG